MKKIIITADDLGIDKSTNQAIKESFLNGTLSGSCLLANGEAFDDAVENVIKSCPNLELGIHLNIIEGKALSDNCKFLTDKDGVFNNSYIDMLVRSYNKYYMSEIEKEFRLQIEKIFQSGLKPVYINTHVHTHSIPEIFGLVCKLANEYGLKYIRTQAEIPYYTEGIKRHLSIHYCLNIIKNILLNTFTFINKKTVKKYGLMTNECFLGVLYTGQMDEETMISGMKKLPKDVVAEIILHPSVNHDKPMHNREYKALMSNKLKEFLNSENVELSRWENL